jgi:hypothetical protein
MPAMEVIFLPEGGTLNLRPNSYAEFLLRSVQGIVPGAEPESYFG